MVSPLEHQTHAVILRDKVASLNGYLRLAHSRGLRCTITTGAQDGGPPQIGVVVQEPVTACADEGWDDRR